jgi:hypothetical protein
LQFCINFVVQMWIGSSSGSRNRTGENYKRLLSSGNNCIRALIEKLKKQFIQEGTSFKILDMVVHSVKRGVRQMKGDDK